MTPFELLTEMVFPRKCVFCGALCDSDLPCPACQETLPWLVGGDAEREVEFISRCFSPLRYDGKVRRAILALKFRRRVGFFRTLGPIAAQCAQDHLVGQCDVVTWVPLSPKRLRQRGFDQAEKLAGYAAAPLELEPVRLFDKKNGVGRQSRLKDAAARRANVLGAYTLCRPELAEGKRVLLVDDLVTSGATLSECARLLRMAGCADVLALTLARAGHPAV